jgi:hypothetical protein
MALTIFKGERSFMDYFVRDNDEGDGMVVNAPIAVDAAQRFIDITRRVDPRRHVNPRALDIFPITRKDALISPVDTSVL